MTGRAARDLGPRGPEHVTWDLATNVDHLLARAAVTTTQLKDEALQWAAGNPIELETMQAPPGNGGNLLFARQANHRPVPPAFSVLAAEVIHGLRTLHDHIRADRKRVAFTLDTATEDDLALLIRADNFTKHQALPLIGSVAPWGHAEVIDELGKATGRLVGTHAPRQAGDWVAMFEFDRDLRGGANGRLAVTEMLVLDGAVLGQPYDLFDLLTKEMASAVEWAGPLLDWLADHPDRPLERRSATGLPLRWTEPRAQK